MTEYSTLHVEWEHISNNASNNARMGLNLLKNNTKTFDVGFSQRGMGFKKRTNSIDISAFSGNFYIKLVADSPVNYAGTSSELFVYRIWFE